ncbi:MAG TPA: DNA-binding transcriptional regulator [Phycisphaerae bacterium]|nr:DNA-binding transcriptional regulator [Phycisphaerae bacterium]
MKTPRVALLVETSNAYARGLLSGIAEYIQQHGSWSIYLPESRRADAMDGRLRGWKGDGIIVRAEDPRTARAALSCGCPIVDLSAAGLLPQVPAVHSDVRAEAATAFDHLWERGFRNLGFCGVSNYHWVRWQLEQFRKLAGKAGIQIAQYVKPFRLTRARGWADDRRALASWLRQLPKPVGIFACYDLRGQQVLDACRFAGLGVPDDVAVLGVDNDVVRCSLSDPPLSSVAPNTTRVGFLAAELLSQLMGGTKIASGLRLVPPIGVIARKSTDALSIGDPDVAAALHFIRENCCSPIGVEQVLARISLSRRTLESRFMRLLGRTPHSEILRCRVERAKQLLSDTDLPIKTLARRVGVCTPEYLSVLFKRTLGTTPSAYRAQYQSIRQT